MKVHVLTENTTCDPNLTAEHGLSLFVETARHKLLFDAGQTDAFADNARRMGVDLSAADLAVLSHGHYDHGGGLRRFMELNARALIYLSRHAFEPHFHGSEKYIGLDAALEGSERFVLTDESLRIDDELSLRACNGWKQIVPVNSFGLCARLGGALIPDDFRHEQYLLIEEAGRRVLFSGCSHKGILNIINWFEPDVLVGGFHFVRLDPETPEGRAALEAAARELMRHPTRYYTGHCTGAAQYRFLKQRMGERLESLSTGAVVEL